MLESGLDTLSTQLLDNRACRELLTPLNDFENAVFGPDFGCPASQVQPWFDSGCLLYAAVCGEAVAGHRRILSVLSIFLTTTAERDRVLSGQAADYEMAPWQPGQPSEPTIYLSSVISAAPHHLLAMYGSLLQDARTFQEARGVRCRTAFGVAAGPAGNRHLARSGFRLLEGSKYRGVYDLMVMDTASAATPFWQGLLGSPAPLAGRPGEAALDRPPGLPIAPRKKDY
ncbi:MAG: hypothetical protein RJA22_2803 [Verrucomicrobiota bacterium]